MSDTTPCAHHQFFGAREFCPDCGLSRTEVLVEACAPFLKDDETPAECIARNRRDVDGCLTMLIAELRKVEELRGLLTDVCERMMEAETTASVLTGQLPQYSEGQQMLSRLAAIMGDSAKQIRAALGTQADQPNDEAQAKYECVGYQYLFPAAFGDGSYWRDSPADYNGMRHMKYRKIFAEVTTDPAPPDQPTVCESTSDGDTYTFRKPADKPTEGA